jgi:hypothetical protein
VFFNGELMDRFVGDEMPSEEDFVATLDTRKKSGKVPTLEASEEDLKKFAPRGRKVRQGRPRGCFVGQRAAAAGSLPPARSHALSAAPEAAGGARRVRRRPSRVHASLAIPKTESA